MNIHRKTISAVTFCTALCVSTTLMAQDRVKPRPAPAAPAAPLVKLKTAVAPVNPNLATLPKKPPVVTAVAPKTVLPGTQHGIIFVGGKPSGGDAALNPQPIPPGHAGPGDPVR
ncbi:MAG TPA: hypothetical protein VHW71_07580 [Steroidobacteraceae bacterium]|jgi:hypothetical protein|nr:hypothetical protein [Steroidobacteraceae bacterium]